MRSATSLMNRVLWTTLLGTTLCAPGGELLKFNRDIRPILSDRCFFCHGTDPETREADLRLDLRAAAISAEAIIPGDPKNSPLIQRINSSDPDAVMPPPESHKDLDLEERAILERWIAQGAEYEPHWAWVPPAKSKTPNMDALVQSGLEEKGLNFSPPADRHTLARRLAFDLTGLPPTPTEVAAFIADQQPDAVARYVDALLASPHFGERMAVGWLDAVRYADSVGYHGDQLRNASPYRDYVIKAFNTNMPYDKFTIEQLAGDLLPNATEEQHTAASYNRLNQISSEGGIQDREYIAKYRSERVRTTSGVWMGATMACCECHDHKFDPFTTRDFYRFGAFFSDILEKGAYTGNGKFQENEQAYVKKGIEFDRWGPALRLRSPATDKKIDVLSKQIVIQEAALKSLPRDHAWNARFAAWVKTQRERAEAGGPLPLIILDEEGMTHQTKVSPEILVDASNGPVHSGRVSRKQQSQGLTQHIAAKEGGPAYTTQAGDHVFCWIYLDPKNPPKQVMLQFNVQGKSWGQRVTWGSKDIVYGKDRGGAAYVHKGALPETGQWVRLEADTAEVGLVPGSQILQTAYTQFGGLAYWDDAGIITASREARLANLPAPISTLFLDGKAPWTPEQTKALQTYYGAVDPILAARKTQLGKLKAERDSLRKTGPTTPRTVSAKPRMVRVLPRGDWTNDSGEIVLPATPSFLPAALESNENQRLTRLDLAKWLIAPENPLTARAFANRVWARFFGQGLTPDVADLGSQGGWPHQQEVLDWLAIDFVEHGWDIKRLVRHIVLSRTYQQQSAHQTNLDQIDPYNHLLARQAPRRLDAEFIRDNALAVSGLLVRDIGGSSVRPYQPAGYYQHLNFPRRTYKPDTGPAQYRRGVYTHWQRTFLHPMLKAFDAPSREECTLHRPNSNTPLQALTLLNDPTFVEAARVLATQALESGEEPIAFAFLQTLARRPSPQEHEALTALHEKAQRTFQTKPEEGKKLLSVGMMPPAPKLSPVDLAAMTQVTRALLNLHETHTRL